MTVALTLTDFGLRGERESEEGERYRKEGEIKGKSRQREQSQ